MASTLLLTASLAVSGIALAQTPSPRLTGKWQFSCTTPRGKTRQFSVQMSQDGSTLSGTFHAPRGTGKVTGDVAGNHVSLILSGHRRTLSLSGGISDGTLTVLSARGLSCSATKQ